jgi:hypothetical protein
VRFKAIYFGNWVEGSEISVFDLKPSRGFQVEGPGFVVKRDKNLWLRGFRIGGSGCRFRICGSGFVVQGAGIRPDAIPRGARSKGPRASLRKEKDMRFAKTSMRTGQGVRHTSLRTRKFVKACNSVI